MLSRDDITLLLDVQQDTYALLMWLADEANRDPYILAPEAVAALRDPATAAKWLEQNRKRLPATLVPAQVSGAFANLLSSFFSTSFRVRHLEFNGRLVESRVTQGAEPDAESRAGVEQCQALALRHLASAESCS